MIFQTHLLHANTRLKVCALAFCSLAGMNGCVEKNHNNSMMTDPFGGRFSTVADGGGLGPMSRSFTPRFAVDPNSSLAMDYLFAQSFVNVVGSEMVLSQKDFIFLIQFEPGKMNLPNQTFLDVPLPQKTRRTTYSKNEIINSAQLNNDSLKLDFDESRAFLGTLVIRESESPEEVASKLNEIFKGGFSGTGQNYFIALASPEDSRKVNELHRTLKATYQRGLDLTGFGTLQRSHSSEVRQEGSDILLEKRNWARIEIIAQKP